MRSSYIQNNYGEVFYDYVKKFTPELIVELGVLDAYSTLHFAKGLEDNKKGRIDAYDLFEDYQFKSSNYDEITRKCKEIKCLKLYKMNAFKVHDRYKDNSVDILHVDISNDGDIVRKIMKSWNSKIVDGGLIMFEGGSLERDEIEWMKKYNKESLREEFLMNQIIRDYYTYETYVAFPSLTVLTKLRIEEE